MKKGAKRKITFIVAFCCLISGMQALGQGSAKRVNSVLPDRLVFASRGPFWPFTASAGQLAATRQNALISPVISPQQQDWRILPADYYVRDFGFFCKKEWEFEKKVHVPLKFRLGSLAYCNYLEGK
jgi:hypothetical protein